MKNHAIRQDEYVQRFTVVAGYKGEAEAIKLKVEACWSAAYILLWNGVFFSGEEETKAKAAIKMFLINADDLHKGYSEFIERLLLSRRYLSTDIVPLKCIPEEWFNGSGKESFNRSAKWYADITATRIRQPLYCLSLKAFADAVLEMAEERNSKVYHYWRGYFLERKRQALLNLFIGVAAYLNKQS